MIGPKTTPTPNIAIALPRSSGGNASRRIACDIGTIAPPAKPWRTRMKTSNGSDGAAPEPSDASVKRPRHQR